MKPALMLFCVMCFARTLFADEPACSRFHYEEQMLEKMVRMEFANEKMRNEMNEAKTRIEHTIENFENMKRAHEQNLEKGKTELNELKDTAQTLTATFTARTLQRLNPERGSILVFTNTLYDFDGNYDNITGIFTTPYRGTYIFTMQLCFRTGVFIYYGIVVEGTPRTRGYWYDIRAYHCNTADVILVLGANERVWVEYMKESTSGKQTLHESSEHWNTFSGTLVHK